MSGTENQGVPTFATTMDLKILKALSNIHTALPGQIEKFDGDKAQVLPLVKAIFKSETGDVVQDLPVISGVPVMFPRWANGGICFPLKKGDTGLILFAERSIEEWVTRGVAQSPNDPRKFDLSDAIFIPGLYPFSQKNALYKNDSLVLSHDDNSFIIKDDGKITAKCEEFIIDGKLIVKNDATFETETITGPTQIKGTKFKVITPLGPSILPIIPE